MTTHKNKFPGLVQVPGGLPLLFEVIPPRKDSPEAKIHEWRDRVVQIATRCPIAAINIPEVREEERGGERTYTYVKRMKPRQFGKLVSEAAPQPIDLVINRVVVYRSIEKQRDWLLNSHAVGIRNIILVGGESGQITYPGPSVKTLAQLIAEEVNPLLPEGERFFCGGIAIPTRRRSDPSRDEPARMLEKIRAGIEFFTTQVIYEADKAARLLSDYAAACQQQNVTPRRVFFSLAPVGQAKHIEFIRWLGAEVPPGTEALLIKGGAKMGEASLDTCCRIVEELMSFADRESLAVPLGFNISPLIRSNTGLGEELAKRIAARFSS